MMTTYFCTESRVGSDGCGRECDEDLCAADDRCNGFGWTKQPVRCNNRIVYGEVEIRIGAIIACLDKIQKINSFRQKFTLPIQI